MNAFKAHLGKIWSHQDVEFDFTANMNETEQSKSDNSLIDEKLMQIQRCAIPAYVISCWVEMNR